MRGIFLRAIATLVVLAGGHAGLAQGVDLLTGRAADAPLCSLTAATAVELFGIPSRAHVEDGTTVVEYSHRGFVLRFANEEAGAPLAKITVYPVDRDGFMGYRGHFLGTVASGTAREPVERILRSARAEIVTDDPGSVTARLEGFDLDVAFLYGVIDEVELICVPAGEPVS